MRGSNTILIVLAVVLVLIIVCCLVLACAGAGFFLLSPSTSSGAKPIERANVSDFCGEYQITDPIRTYDEYHGTMTFDCDKTMWNTWTVKE
jgi:hypothetical protein